MNVFLRILAAAAIFGAAASAADDKPNRTVVGPVLIDIPAGWSHDDAATFTSPGGGLTLAVSMVSYTDDPDDVLEDVVEDIEAGETVVERGDPQEVQMDNPGLEHLWSRETTVKLGDGRTVRRLYMVVEDEHLDAVNMAVVSGELSAWASDGVAARAVLESLSIGDQAGTAAGELPDPLPADGGLDGVYFHTEDADWLDTHWKRGPRTVLLLFGPLGEVIRGPQTRFDLSRIDACGGGSGWTTGRYRIEGGSIVMRWCDRTVERWPFAKSDAGLTIGRRVYAEADTRGVETPKGAYALRDDLAGDSRPSLQFLDGGKLVLQGITAFGPDGVRFKKGAATPARFALKGRDLTIIYERGTSEVVGFARLPGGEGDTLLVGGMVFTRPD